MICIHACVKTVLSPKFARKLNYVSSLSQLAAHIKLDSKFIPQRVVEYDRQLPVMNQTSPLTGYSAPSTSLAFGRTLEELAGIEGKNIHGYIPKIVLQITNHIRKHGNYGYCNHRMRYLLAGMDRYG